MNLKFWIASLLALLLTLSTGVASSVPVATDSGCCGPKVGAHDCKCGCPCVSASPENQPVESAALLASPVVILIPAVQQIHIPAANSTSVLIGIRKSAFRQWTRAPDSARAPPVP